MAEINNISNKISHLLNIKSKYILKKIFDNIQQIQLLNIIRYNKTIQSKLDITINDYKLNAKIEIEVIPMEKKENEEIEIDNYFDDKENIYEYVEEKFIRPLMDELRKKKEKKFINVTENESNYHIYFNDDKEEIKRKKRDYILVCYNITKIRIIIDNGVKSLSGLFRGCDIIKKISFIKFNIADIETMDRLFDGCSSLEYLDISKMKTNNVRIMNHMFQGSSSLTELNLSNFNTHNATDMTGMFYECSSLEELNLSNFNTKYVTNMHIICSMDVHH